MTHLVDQLLGLNPWLVLGVVGLLVFAEDAIFLGFVIPGETAAVVAGVAASIDHVSVYAALAVVIAAAIIGDSVGFEVGRYLGPRLTELKVLARHRQRVENTQDFLRRKGGPAVFLGRFTAFFRAMMPAMAGASQMHYWTFLRWNAIGGVVWGTLFVLVGYLAGRSYAVVEKQIGRGIAVALVLIAVAAFVAWRVRARHKEQALGAPSAGADRE